MPSRIAEAGHTKADVGALGGKSKNETVPGGIEPTSAHTYESEIQRSTTYATPTSQKIKLHGEKLGSLFFSFFSFLFFLSFCVTRPICSYSYVVSKEPPPVVPKYPLYLMFGEPSHSVQDFSAFYFSKHPVRQLSISARLIFLTFLT